MRSWRKPSLLAWLLLIAGLALFVSLGFWQHDRAEFKRERERARLVAESAPERALADALAVGASILQRVRTSGRYRTLRYLLDNQVRDHQAGVDVFALFDSDDAGPVLVALGWLPYAGNRREPPDLPPLPDGHVELHGLWSPPPAHGLRLGRDWPAQPAYPKLMPYFDIADVGADAKTALPPGVLRLDDETGSPYRRDHAAADGLPPARHVAYALQWWSLALAIVIVFVFVHRPRDRT